MSFTFKELFPIIEAKHHGFRTPDATDFEVGKNIRGNLIRRGMVLAMKYPQGDYVYVEVLGFTNNKEKYGESGVAYNSAKEMLAANNVKNFKDLEELDDENEYGYHHYMVLRDLTRDVVTVKDNIFNVYLYKGRWAVGSSADRVSFYEARYVPNKKINEARYHGNDILPRVETFDDPHDIDNRSYDLQEQIGKPVTGVELGFIEGMPKHYGYFGLFYDGTTPHTEYPDRKQTLSMIKKTLSEMHEDPEAVDFADCIADSGSVYYSNHAGKHNYLYCED